MISAGKLRGQLKWLAQTNGLPPLPGVLVSLIGTVRGRFDTSDGRCVNFHSHNPETDNFGYEARSQRNNSEHTILAPASARDINYYVLCLRKPLPPPSADLECWSSFFGLVIFFSSSFSWFARKIKCPHINSRNSTPRYWWPMISRSRV